MQKADNISKRMLHSSSVHDNGGGMAIHFHECDEFGQCMQINLENVHIAHWIIAIPKGYDENYALNAED